MVEVYFKTTVGENIFEGEADVTPGRPKYGPDILSGRDIGAAIIGTGLALDCPRYSGGR
jgi:hypothetical protein